METYAIYLLKASIGLVLFYLFYFLVLRKETYYSSNRLYLVMGLLLAALLPLFPISYSISTIISDTSDFFAIAKKSAGETMYVATDSDKKVPFARDPLFIFSVIYVAGASFFLLRLILQTIIVVVKLHNGKRRLLNGISIIDVKSEFMPFSFFNMVVINIKAYSKEELSNIIAHERVHIQERHWIDLLIIELLTVVFWINPIVWLYERSIKQNHEYLADRAVLLAGYHPGQYQALLINQLMGVEILGLTNSLTCSLNKNRMEMMKKEKSKSRMRLLLVLPVIVVLTLAFAEKKNVILDNNKKSLIDQAFEVQDMINLKGIIKTEEGISLEGAHIILKNTSKGTVSDNNGKFEINIPIDGVLVISYIGYETISVTEALPGETFGIVNVKMKEEVSHIELPYIDNTYLANKNNLPPPSPAKHRKNNEVMTIVEQMPYYRKRMPSLAFDITRAAKLMMEKTIDRGEVLVGFTIDTDGKVINPHIIESANSKFLDSSALKIIALLDDWEPGVQRGKPVKVNLSVPVHFN